MKKLKTFFLVAVAALSLTSSAWAQQAVFFETLYDVPVMPGLVELPEGALVFDKPSGRIAQAEAAGESVLAREIQGFYRESLPQLGWVEHSKGSYRREGEALTLEIREEEGFRIVHFTLSPLN